MQWDSSSNDEGMEMVVRKYAKYNYAAKSDDKIGR